MESELHEAVRRNDAARVSRLLADGAAADDADWLGRTPLHCAATSGADALARLLLDAGADVDARDEDGVSPAHLCVALRSASEGPAPDTLLLPRRAARGGHAAVLRVLLLEHGADPAAQVRPFCAVRYNAPR